MATLNIDSLLAVEEAASEESNPCITEKKDHTEEETSSSKKDHSEVEADSREVEVKAPDPWAEEISMNHIWKDHL